MKTTRLVLFAAALTLGLSACDATTSAPATPAADSATSADAFEGDPWPAIRERRLAELLPVAMDRVGVDAWLTICRENDNDPMAAHIGCENAGGTAAFLFFRTDDGVTSVGISPAGEATALAEKEMLDEVVVVERGSSPWALVAAQFERFEPTTIAINSALGGSGGPISDGLSHSQYLQLEEALGSRWMSRTVPSAPLIQDWLAIKLPEEVEIMRRAAEITARWEEEAYAAAVGGVTTDRDIADFLEAKMAEAGVLDAWSPEQNPAINSGKDRGHSHPTERVIQPGDFIQTDFGIRVHDRWVTDIQRFAYVLAPGETEPPPEALARWEAAKAGGRAAFAAMRPGATGADVDRAQREVMAERESLPVMWSTGHPVGYWAHDSGPALSGGKPGATPSGRQLLELREGMTFAFDGFFKWNLNDEETKTISVEEMVVITADGAEWLTPPQEGLILISTP